MGTEIQAKTYFSGSSSTRDLNASAGSGIWAQYREHKTLKNDHYYNPFLISPAIDGYLGYDKEQLRQTILKHELIFRHQLEELHRLYKRQRDLISEIKRRQLQQCNMFQGRLLNFELPTAAYVTNEGNWLEKCFPLDGSREVICERDVNLCPRRTRDMVDLNKPVQVVESSVSDSVDDVGNVICHDKPSSYLPSCRSNREPRRKWTIFGVEICEVNPSNSKILGLPIDVNSPSSPCRSNSLASDGDGRHNGSNNLDQGQLEVTKLVTDKDLGDYVSGLRHHIDLNLCLNEDEVPPVPSLPSAILKIATTEIDLEGPAVLESAENPSQLPLDESNEHNEELVRVAAEAITAISSSNLTSSPLPVLSSDSLYWFAEVVSFYECDLEGELNDEDSVPDGMDYFEFMTLRLTETKVDEYCYNSPCLQYQKEEERESFVLSKRPRRCQARRGRQSKDFQRDVLPGLVSLSRHEVSEDFQAFEMLFKASGFTWQPSLSRRNGANKKGRGRRRLSGSAPAVEPSSICRELVLGERTLTGWGKRTRRLPRQRCPIGNPARALKC